MVSAIVFLALGASTSAQTRVGGEREPCVQASANARFDGVGYGHWVSVNNTCDHPVICEISTNVAPAAVTVSVPRGERREVNTFLSSPAREFTPTVSCHASR